MDGIAGELGLGKVLGRLAARHAVEVLLGRTRRVRAVVALDEVARQGPLGVARRGALGRLAEQQESEQSPGRRAGVRNVRPYIPPGGALDPAVVAEGLGNLRP